MTTCTRRQFITLSALLAGSAALSGCASPANLLGPRRIFDHWPNEASANAWRVLNRISFGPRPEERRRAAEIGLKAFIEEQLAPDSLNEDRRALLRARRLESLHLDASDLFDVKREVAARELQQAAVLRAVYSRRQLYEVMVNFWSDHFNITQLKGDCAWLKTVDDREVIRPHALGNFRDLLFASARSPAMLTYLDNQENRVGNPNENYARELMELHTLGVNSGYTQRDVQALARCLTGWTVKRHFYRGHFAFKADSHDDAPKRVLGLNIPAGSGQAGAEAVLEKLAAHPAAARFIAKKLTRRFVSDDPPPALVARAARAFLKSNGDIKSTLRVILFSPEFLSPAATTRKLKRPFNYVVSALRQLNAQSNGGPALLTHLSEMGQLPFHWTTPDGYPDKANFWQGTLLGRWQFALALAHNNIPGTKINLEELANLASTGREREIGELLDQFSTLLLGRPLPKALSKRLLEIHQAGSEATLLATLLASPAFQWK
ncbi:MAG TPA: DUF1800 domain-containing protein [Anaerolineae bacterium]|nr:DUF1800 domain-containing protein [Anaerolineae bacterium]